MKSQMQNQTPNKQSSRKDKVQFGYQWRDKDTITSEERENKEKITGTWQCDH